MEFLNKEYFILLLFIPIVLYLLYKSYKKQAIKFSFLDDLKKVFSYWKLLLVFQFALLTTILSLFIVILANPNKTNVEKKISKNGIDIVLTLDVSESMNAEDLKPTRIEAAKSIINQFIWKLKNDRVGLVIFAWKPFTSVPLTFDYDIVRQTLKNLKTSILNKNNPDLAWTNIWDALLMAKNLFKKPKDMKEQDYKKRQKVVILLTDGDANRWVDPKVAAYYLKKFGIKVYTIWVGSPYGSYISYQVWPFIQRAKIPPLKTETLKQIASLTNGKFFRATDNNSLQAIFAEIASLTRTKIETKQKKIYNPNYLVFAEILAVLMSLFVLLKIREI